MDREGTSSCWRSQFKVLLEGNECIDGDVPYKRVRMKET